MSEKRTAIASGFKICMMSLPFMFLGPYITHLGFNFRNYITLGIGIILMFVAMFILFKGLRKIVNALFL